MNLKQTERTDRGLRWIAFRDLYESECSISESSSAEYESLWLGEVGHRMHLDRKQAGFLSALLSEFATNGRLPDHFVEIQAESPR